MISLALLALMGLSWAKILFFAGLAGLLVAPILDYALSRRGLHLPILRHLRYFVVMNIALLHGLILYVYGIKNSVWEPPKRNRKVSVEQH